MINIDSFFDKLPFVVKLLKKVAHKATTTAPCLCYYNSTGTTPDANEH